jgi:LPS-assembly lipoprotein
MLTRHFLTPSQRQPQRQSKGGLNHLRGVLTLVFLATILSACGFHLRGNIPLPDGIKNMFIASPAGTFKEQLGDVLTNSGAQLSPNKAGADVVLRIIEARSDRTVGTLDERGKANSYNLVFSVRYRLEDAEGNLLREAKVSEVRRYNFNPEQVIESESEEADLLEDMEQDVALRMVRQLSTVTDLDFQE